MTTTVNIRRLTPSDVGVFRDHLFTQGDPKNLHMQALWSRAIDEDAPIVVEGFPETIDYTEDEEI